MFNFQIMELLTSSIEFFRDHEIVALNGEEEKSKGSPAVEKKAENGKDVAKEKVKPVVPTKPTKIEVKKGPAPTPPPRRASPPEPSISIKRKDEAPKVKPVPPPMKMRRGSIVLDQRSRIEIEIFETEATFVNQMKMLIAVTKRLLFYYFLVPPPPTPSCVNLNS